MHTKNEVDDVDSNHETIKKFLVFCSRLNPCVLAEEYKHNNLFHMNRSNQIIIFFTFSAYQKRP
jgi:hypothetical protein